MMTAELSVSPEEIAAGDGRAEKACVQKMSG
jgi:hypothetical protein